MAANVTMIPPIQKKPDALRVAAYCRVSSDSADQLHSYAAQIKAYSELISRHDNWELVDIYADGPVKIGLNQKHPYNKGSTDLVLFLFCKYKRRQR